MGVTRGMAREQTKAKNKVCKKEYQYSAMYKDGDMETADVNG